MLKENSFGILKRYNFISDVIESELQHSIEKPLKVLDVGCGTGEMITIPLAKRFGKYIKLFAFDVDKRSLMYLKNRCWECNLNNVVIMDSLTTLENSNFEIIIMSEVIEHVPHPIEFLSRFIRLLKPHGKMIITLPNGYGYFELDSLLTGILEVTGIMRILRYLKQFVLKGKSTRIGTRDTLAISPHVNFFSFNQVKALFEQSRLKINRYEGRTFMCGFFVSRFIDKSEILLKLNDLLGSKLPPWLVSGWMFVTIISDENPNKNQLKVGLFQRWYTRLKRYINMKRHKITKLTDEPRKANLESTK